MKNFNLIVLLTLFLPLAAFAQEVEKTVYTYQTFRDTRIVNGHSTETGTSGEMKFIIQHRFGNLNGGAYELYGLDQSSVRFGFDYALNGWMDIGFGRSSYGKYYDFYFKSKLLSQSTGAKTMPISAAVLINGGVTTLKWADPTRQNYFSSKLTYVNQLLLSRKFGTGFSLQLMPTHVHRNLVRSNSERNDVFGIGIASRVQLTKVIAWQTEYYYVPSGQTNGDFENSLSLGFEFQTRGHVFQIHLSNSSSMVENLFVTETNGKWSKGDIRLGFNMTRDFKFRGRKFRSL